MPKPTKSEGPKSGPKGVDGPKFRVFFPSPTFIFVLFFVLGGPKAARGFHTTARELETSTLEGPRVQKTPPKFNEKTPRERQKERKWERREETKEKERNFGRSRRRGIQRRGVQCREFQLRRVGSWKCQKPIELACCLMPFLGGLVMSLKSLGSGRKSVTCARGTSVHRVGHYHQRPVLTLVSASFCHGPTARPCVDVKRQGHDACHGLRHPCCVTPRLTLLDT